MVFKTTQAATGARRPWAAVAMAVVVAVTLPRTTTAESPPRTLSDEAKQHYESGQSYYQQGKYAEAAAQLRKAYLLTPKPMLLYNIMLAEWRAGDLSEAITMGRRARKEKLPETIGEKVDARLAAFGALQTARTVASEGADAGQPRQPSSSAESDDASATAEASDTGNSPAATPSPRRWPRIAGWWALGSGIVGIGGAGIYAVMTRQAVTERDRALEAGDRQEARRIWRSDIRPRQRTGRIFLSTGAGLAAAGGGLLLIDALQTGGSAPDDSPSVELAPRLGPGTLQLGIVGQF